MGFLYMIHEHDAFWLSLPFKLIVADKQILLFVFVLESAVAFSFDVEPVPVEFIAKLVLTKFDDDDDVLIFVVVFELLYLNYFVSFYYDLNHLNLL